MNTWVYEEYMNFLKNQDNYEHHHLQMTSLKQVYCYSKPFS